MSPAMFADAGAGAALAPLQDIAGRIGDGDAPGSGAAASRGCKKASRTSA